MRQLGASPFVSLVPFSARARPKPTHGAVDGRPSLGNQVGKHKSIAFDNFSRPHRDGAREYGRILDERVKFPVLAARVDSRGQSLEQPKVVVTAGKGFRDLRG